MQASRSILLVCCMACVAPVALAQVGSLTVIVSDADGAPLAGATVTISHETAFVKTTSERSDRQGTVRFPVLRPGPGYTIQVSFAGLSPLRYADLRVKLNERQTLRVQMIEAVEEQVRVTADRGTVDLDKTETSTKFSDDFIGDLPVLDRFYQNVLTMAPGVQDADEDGNPNVHGSRTRDFQAIVGGVSNVDPLTGQWLSRVNPNSIEEMEVITAGAGVEFGRAQGGFARIVQKQGGNRHEGIVEFHYQTSKLDGDGANDLSDLEEPEFETLQPAFQFSGPLIKDKLWYRASYERREREEPINVLTGLAVFTNDSETQDAQITWQVSPRNKLAFKFRSDPADQENFGVSSRIPEESSQRLGRDVETWELAWTAPYSPKVLVENTVAWQDVALSMDPSLPGVPNECVPGSADAYLRDAICLDLVADRISGSFNEESDDNRQRFTVKTQATVYAGRFWGANHQFKLGLQIENERYFRRLKRLPSITYEEVRPFGGQPFAIVLADVDVPVSDRVQATGNSWAVYAEDQLKPWSNLTVTLGARVDQEELDSQGFRPLDLIRELQTYEGTLDLAQVGPNEVDVYLPGDWFRYFTGFEAIDAYRTQVAAGILCAGVPEEQLKNCIQTKSPEIVTQFQNQLQNKRRASGVNLRNTNVSPFVSFAWDPWSDGKTAVKGAVGRHYNNIPLIVPLQELEPVRTTFEVRADLATFQTQILGGISPNITVRTVDSALETPYQDEYTLSFEREIWAETSLHLTYINRRFRDQLQDQNLNLVTQDYGVCADVNTQFLYNTYVILTPDGVEDDCGGVTQFFGGDGPLGSGAFRLQFPDGLPDLYVQSPFWGGVFEIGNLNSIDYDAVVLELVRRQYRGWEMNASYTWSEAIGDGEDFIQELADDPSLRGTVFGDQSYDQRHVFKLNGTTITPWGVRLGTSVTWQSGLPYSILREDTSDDILPPSTSVLGFKQVSRLRQIYPTGVRNDQRNASYWNVDLKATKELRVGRELNLQLSVELFNALDDDTYVIYNPFFERGQQINDINEAQRRFGRRWQLGVRAAF